MTANRALTSSSRQPGAGDDWPVIAGDGCPSARPQSLPLWLPCYFVFSDSSVKGLALGTFRGFVLGDV